MTTINQVSAFQSYYNECLEELKKDVQWTTYSFLYEGDAKRDDIFSWFQEEISFENVIRMEKNLFWKPKAIPETKQATVNVPKLFIIQSVSHAAGDPLVQKEFRDKVLPDENSAGAFVAHQMFVEFFKSSNQMLEISDKNNTTLRTEAEKLTKQTIEKITTFGDSLFPFPIPHFSMNYLDVKTLESPQSTLVAALIQWTIALEWKKRSKEDCPIFAVHQAAARAGGEKNINIIQGDRKKTDNKSSSALRSSVGSPTKKRVHSVDNTSVTVADEGDKSGTFHQIVDILIWFPHASLGNSIISAVEYKPDISTTDCLVAQADMYATNIINTYKSPCIAVQIEGGYSWKSWNIKATAIVPNDHGMLHKENFQWCKSELFTGIGAEGLYGLAAGLVAAYVHYPKEKNEFGSLLGPVVGYSGDKVFKAFVNATYRKPNLELVQKYTDPNAKLYSTSDEKKHILEMKYVKGHWDNEIKVSIFVLILDHLKQLHNDGIVHGDIRLANMLSTGVLIDFDLAGREGVKKYPAGYQVIKRDGKRHMEIVDKISKSTKHVDLLKEVTLEKDHDCFSMAFVMGLFQVCSKQEDSVKDCWDKATKLVQYNDLAGAISLLKQNDFIVSLAKENLEGIYGTGGTPPPKI